MVGQHFCARRQCAGRLAPQVVGSAQRRLAARPRFHSARFPRASFLWLARPGPAFCLCAASRHVGARTRALRSPFSAAVSGGGGLRVPWVSLPLDGKRCALKKENLNAGAPRSRPEARPCGGPGVSAIGQAAAVRMAPTSLSSLSVSDLLAAALWRHARIQLARPESGILLAKSRPGSAISMRETPLPAPSVAAPVRQPRRLAPAEDLQASWLLLLFCEPPQCNHVLRLLQPGVTAASAVAHDAALLDCLSDLLQCGPLPALPARVVQLRLRLGAFCCYFRPRRLLGFLG